MKNADREFLVAIQRDGPLRIDELVARMGVTATAVRARIERLLSSGWVERKKMVSGRGRPTFQYLLTEAGRRAVGAAAADMAEALWQEIMALGDESLRRRIVSGVARRLANQLAEELDDSQPVDQKIQQLSDVMARRDMVVQAETGDLPVLDICVCPYPSLADVDSERSMCRLEEQMISEAIGQPVHLSSCRLDGDHCCQFTAAVADGDSK
ncbi:MAG: winged helix-turn-helix transcriptional regulator [Planctomycetota bacterium]